MLHMDGGPSSCEVHGHAISSASSSPQDNDGFFLAFEDIGRMFDDSFPACAFLSLFFLGGD